MLKVLKSPWLYAVVCVFLVLLNIKRCRPVQQPPNTDSLQAVIDSLLRVDDTIRIIEERTVTKWRVKNEKEIKYIYISVDSLQPTIRAELRARYIAER